MFKRTLDFQAQIIILPPNEVSRPLHQTGDGAMLAVTVHELATATA
ncbi:MAG: hypothetical protein QJT81_13690 [Candidatus Thiothrix putei]|uniref:Uncharacterized protein n=1 Tax=Candidatus Thiothrix putei TaxID=3080811 RepID=A0AA95KMI8_9GAMM|nr:MAG: hypothetical protein QJT81_13690 [Candidatus Thiothrix putei]